MKVDWDDAVVADRFLKGALAVAAQAIARDSRRLTEMREEDLRGELHEALSRSLSGAVRKEKALVLNAFRGVGGFDVLVDRSPGVRVAWLAEVKWSFTQRSKIFEAVWDAVKLCLGAAEQGVSRCWLVTGAPNSQWETAECRQLFRTGKVPFRELWEHALVPPGPNGGSTVGEDLLEGGRGNRFTRAPKVFSVDQVSRRDLRPDGEDWSIRAVAVTAADGWIEEFAAPPPFPGRITQTWLESNVPGMAEDEFAQLLEWLKRKRWTEDELAKRVFPLRRPGNAGIGQKTP